jgi:hypothetical protein
MKRTLLEKEMLPYERRAAFDKARSRNENVGKLAGPSSESTNLALCGWMLGYRI